MVHSLDIALLLATLWKTLLAATISLVPLECRCVSLLRLRDQRSRVGVHARACARVLLTCRVRVV